MQQEKYSFMANNNNKDERLDKFLAGKINDLSRSYIQSLIEEGEVVVNGKRVKKSYCIESGDQIKLIIPPSTKPELKAVEMDLDIIYEDDYIIVVNKPAGLIVHPVPGNRDHTLVNGLLACADGLSGIGGVKRPGIVHRLDKNTSGVMVVAKDDQSHRRLVTQFKERNTKKIYRAIVCGDLPYKKGKIDAPIGRDSENRTKMTVVKKNSKKAVSKFKLLQSFDDYSYVEIELKTGRTHQIRVHFSYLGFPVLGDDKYGISNNRLKVERQLLHAFQLGLNHPESDRWMCFKAPLPADFRKTLQILNNFK